AAANPVLASRTNRVEMHGDGLFDVTTVAAGHRNGDWHVEIAREIKDAPVARLESVDGKLEATQPIARVRVRACKIDHEIRGKTPPHFLQRGVERRQILGIAGAIFQADVEIAPFFPEGKVRFAMDRQREAGVVAGEDARGPVSLVYIEIDDRDAQSARVQLL